MGWGLKLYYRQRTLWQRRRLFCKESSTSAYMGVLHPTNSPLAFGDVSVQFHKQSTALLSPVPLRFQSREDERHLYMCISSSIFHRKHGLAYDALLLWLHRLNNVTVSHHPVRNSRFCNNFQQIFSNSRRCGPAPGRRIHKQRLVSLRSLRFPCPGMVYNVPLSNI